MSTVLPFGSNTISTFLYEAFSYTISNPAPGTYTLTTSNTPGIPPGYVTNNGSNVVFAASSNGMGIGTEVFTITAKDLSLNTVAVSSNTVTIGAGRFTDPSGNSYVGSNYTFYKNEPITPVRLVAPFDIATPTTVPALPPGLGYSTVSGSTYDIAGTPLVTVPQSNYLFIGKGTGTNLGKIVTSQFQLSVGNERVVLNLSGTPIVSPMTVGTAITPRVLTARYPPYPSGGTLRYSWPGLPDGIVATDLSGTIQVGTVFTPSDASATLIISGTPTITAANNFRDANIASTTVPFAATRTNPLPQISNSQAITFGFGESVLFDTTVVPPLYTGVTLDPSATFYRAQTYFGSGSAISNIFSPNLRSDLSLNFVAGTGKAYLTGTPGASTGTASYTIRAINSNAVSRDLSSSITVAADTVSFVSPPTPAVDVCYNFVLSRPISLDISGYYPTPIQFQATDAAGKPITFSAPALSGTGISLSNVSANVVQLVGIPDTVTPLTTVALTASAVGTPATASQNFKLAVLDDVITVSDVSASALAWVQNRAIAPIQLSSTTLSGRSVLSYISSNLPLGISMTTTGLLTGTPTEFTIGTAAFTVTASTGFTSQNKTFNYTVVKDNIITVLRGTTATVDTVFSNIAFDVITYSGIEGQFSNNVDLNGGIQPKQRTTATVAVTPPNLLSGDFSTVPVLAPEYRFYLLSRAGDFGASTLIRVVSSGGPTFRHVLLQKNSETLPNTSLVPAGPLPLINIGVSTTTSPVYSFQSNTSYLDEPGPSNWTKTFSNTTFSGTGYDMARSSNVYVMVAGSNIFRSTDYGETWSNIPSSNIQPVSGVYGPRYSGNVLDDPPSPAQRLRIPNPTFGAIACDGSSNWWALGFGTYDYQIPIPEGEVGAIVTAWLPSTLVRYSTDNGVTWTDILISGTTPLPPPNPYFLTFVGPTNPWQQSNKLHYNQGRLFYTGWEYNDPQIPGSSFFYADTSDLYTWTRPLGGAASIIGLGFSNSTVLAAGASNNVAALKLSTDNGTTWSDVCGNPLEGELSSYSTLTGYSDVFQKYGYWFLGGKQNNGRVLSITSNLSSSSNTNWSGFRFTGSGNVQATAENGITWIHAASSNALASTSWTGTNAIGPTAGVTTSGLSNVIEQKRLFAEVIPSSSSNQSLTIFIPYDASGIVFTSPTQTQYTNWQYTAIPTINMVASNPAPGSYMYYYASGLPRGLQLNLDVSGIVASITGTSSQYSDAYQNVILYAALNPGSGGGGVASLPISMRTVLPTVQKQQTSAGAWTSYVRQYTVVNAAQNSVNGRALPATEPPLGEFTRPEPPDSVSAESDPNCVKKC